MKAVLQRVTSAGVAIDGGPRQGIGPGLVVLFGVEEGDREEYVDAFVQKIVQLRIFSDEAGKLNLSLLDQGYSVLAVPNFTLCANCKKGRRPSFERSARPNFASACFDALAAGLRAAGAAEVVCGQFGADMAVDLVNDGPVTLILDSAEIVKQ